MNIVYQTIDRLFSFQFSTKDRAIFGLLLTAAVFLFDLIIPGLAYGLKNWKILQGVVSAPLILTAVLYWYVKHEQKIKSIFIENK